MFARLRFAAALFGLVLAAPGALADATLPTRDAPGTKDNPLLPRYEGSYLLSRAHKQFTDFNLPLSPLEKTERLDGSNNNLWVPKKAKELEGELSRLVYLLPENRSPLEVLRNYQDVVGKAGGEVLFECKREECGGDPARAASGGGGDSSLTMYFVTEKQLEDAPFSNGNCALTNRIADQRFFAARIPVDGGDAHVAVQTFTIPDGGAWCKAFTNRSFALVQVLAPKGRDRRMVVVKADEMAKAIDTTGRVALYGLLFDTDKAELKPESDPTLAEIAALLKGNPTLAVVVVGHTDNVGAYDYNIDLSKRRAAAVVAALAKRHGVPAERMRAAGVGMVAPTAVNATEEGRAKNRRVEVVRMN